MLFFFNIRNDQVRRWNSMRGDRLVLVDGVRTLANHDAHIAKINTLLTKAIKKSDLWFKTFTIVLCLQNRFAMFNGNRN